MTCGTIIDTAHDFLPTSTPSARISSKREAVRFQNGDCTSGQSIVPRLATEFGQLHHVHFGNETPYCSLSTRVVVKISILIHVQEYYDVARGLTVAEYQPSEF